MGDGYHPDSLSKQFNDVVNVLNSPQGAQYLQTINSQIPAVAAQQLKATQDTSGGFLQNDINNYNKYGAQLNAQQNDQANALSQGAIANDLSNLTGQGGELARKTQELMQQIDPEFYKNRSLLGDNLAKAQASLTDTVSPSARAELERALNRNGGNQNPSSAISVASNAMKFGQQGQEATNNLIRNIQGVAAALPQLKSGADLFGIATGRAGLTGNVAQSQLSQANAPGIGDAGLQSGAAFGSQLQNTRLQNDKTRAAGFRSIGDQIEQSSRTFSNVAGGAASFGA